jgi:ABC-2 type transport system permease protein
MVNERGWRMGFANLLRKENRDWWRTRRWLINTIIWLLLINGIAYAMLWVPVPDPASPDPETAERILLPAEQAVPSALMNLVIMAGLFTPIGAIITMQGVIIDEKKSGTAAWIMSKPVSRVAFIMSKLLANAVPLLLLSIVIQWIGAYILLTARGGTFEPLAFAFGVALLGLHLLFYIALTLMLGTFFNDRAPVIAIPIGILFAAQFLMNSFPVMASLSPWGLIFPNGNEMPAIMQAISGMPLTSLAPVIATIAWIVIFTVVAVWRFQREEF